MINTGIIVLAAVLMPVLLHFEKKESTPGKLLLKTPLSLLFILAALIQEHPHTEYYHIMLAGLLLCLGGDVLLIFPPKKAFLAGLVSFLLGHVFYVAAFLSVSQPSYTLLLPAAAVCAFSIGIFMWLKPHLGSMTLPVILYVVVITGMVVAAGSVLLDGSLPAAARWLIAIGALLFYFSDLFVARNRFVVKAHLNRMVGLPLYYTGQFLLAFSVGIIV